jgi:hypothetical protein
MQSQVFNKLKSILAQDKKDESLNDIIYKYQLKLLFGISDNFSFKLLFNEKSHIAKIIYKIVDLLFWLLKVQKGEREEIYNSSVMNIKDKDIKKLLAELNMLQIYDLEINNNLVNLFKIVSDFIEKKKEKATVAEYIDSILLSLSFNTGLDSFLKYQIFLINIQFFLDKYGIVLSYKYCENEINVTEDKSIDLIMDLFTKDVNDFASLIQSIIILNYNSLKDVIDNLSVKEIILGIEDIAKRLKDIKHVGKISICVEKIIEMFADEIEGKRNNKKNKNKKSEKQKKKEEIKETEITTKINEGNISINIPKNTIEMNLSVNSLNKIKEGIKDKCPENTMDNQKLIIINRLNKIFNKIKMGNEVLKEDFDNLQKLMVNIADNNDNLKKDVEKLTQEMKKKDLEIEKHKQDIAQLIEQNEKLIEQNEKQSQDIENLEERVGFLEEDCENLKDAINKIKFRDLSKNFLKYFHDYLTQEDLNLIKANKDLRGEIISNRIGILYPNADKEKMKVIKNLVKSSSDLINEGNYLAHSITLSEYENEIECYKQEKKLEQVKSPVIFCFVYFLGISKKFDDLFENSYNFLRLYFNRNLKSAKSKDLLDNYFNY